MVAAAAEEAILAAPEGRTLSRDRRWRGGSTPMSGLMLRTVSVRGATVVGAVAEGTAAPTWLGGLVSKTALPAG